MGEFYTDAAPQVWPMAVLRNAHEVLRGAMRDIRDLLEEGDFEGAGELWRKFIRFQDLHKKMEEGCKDEVASDRGYGGMFRMIDAHADGVASKADLLGSHAALLTAEHDLDKVFNGPKDIEKAKKAFAAFMEDNEEHLKGEENVMMPSIQKMVKGGKPVKKLLKEEIVSVLVRNDDDIAFFLHFGNEILQRHDNVPDKPRVRVFNHAFWSVATVEQWPKWNKWIKDSLPPEKYEEVHAAASWC